MVHSRHDQGQPKASPHLQASQGGLILWHLGLWRRPIRVLDSTVCIRLEYEHMKEPPHVQAFRERMGGLYSFTWAPSGSQAAQELFFRRWQDQGTWACELLTWDRLGDTHRSVFLDGKSWPIALAVMADFNASVADNRAVALYKSDRRAVAARNSLDERGEREPFIHSGAYIKNVSGAQAWKDEARKVAAHKKARNPES